MRPSEEPGASIRREIAERGSIGFDRYMELALYGPRGFFHRRVVGADAEFVTGPHVHPFVFSRALRAAILETWAELGEPSTLRLVELGAGDGSLATALLDAFAELPSPTIDYVAVEIGESARAALTERGVPAVDALDHVEPFEGVVVANELLDNLPFRLARRSGDGVAEIHVTVAHDRLAFVEHPWKKDSSRPAPEDLHDDRPTVVPTRAATMVRDIARTLRRGAAILVDYGGHGPATDVRGYAHHREIDDVLAAEPGTSDITAGVDLGLIARLAEAVGLAVWPPVRQREALEALGASRWDEAMRARQTELAEAGRHTDALRVFEARSRASILRDPSRLGSLWWVVVSTPDLREPPWLGAARARASAD